MRRFLLSLLLVGFIFTLGQGQDPITWFDFEEDAAQHPEFSGSLYKGVRENPAKAGANLSDSVGLGFTGANSWDGFTYNFPAALNLSTIQSFTMKVYHPTLSGETRLQFGPGGDDLKLDVMYTTPGEWAELTWDIPDGYDGILTKVLICFAHDRAEADEEWYFDELKGAPTYMVTGPQTYYSTKSKRVDVTGFQGAVFEGVVENPDDFLFVYHLLGISKLLDRVNVSKKRFTPDDPDSLRKYMLSVNDFDQRVYDRGLELNRKFRLTNPGFKKAVVIMQNNKVKQSSKSKNKKRLITGVYGLMKRLNLR